MSKRNCFISIVLCLALTTFVKAQDDFKQELSFGINGGVTFSTVSFSPHVYQNTFKEIGLQGGVTLRWITEKNLGLLAELNYSQQGWAEDYTKSTIPDAGNCEYQRVLNYIELPVMTHIYFGNKRVRFFVNLGPKIGYLLSESTHMNFNPEIIQPQNRSNVQHTMPVEKKLDWGITGGPGFELRTGIGYFLLEGRYYFALGNIYESERKDPFQKSNSQVVSIKLSYLFNLWK